MQNRNQRPAAEQKADLREQPAPNAGLAEPRLLLSTVPGVNKDAVYIFHESRKPTGAGMLILYYAGGLLLLAGGLFWIFLVH